MGNFPGIYLTLKPKTRHSKHSGPMNTWRKTVQSGDGDKPQARKP